MRRPHVLGQPRHARVGGEGAGAHLVGADEPLVDHAEDQLVPAAPARRVPVAMRSLAHEEAGGAQARCDLGRHLGHALALERTVAGDVAAALVGGREDGEAVAPAQLEVLLAAARGDVHDARALVRRHLVPLDHPMLDALLRGQVVEGPRVAPSHEGGAGQALAHVGEAGQARAGRRGHVVAPVAHLHGLVGQLRVHGEGDVGGQRPRRGGPREEEAALAILHGEGHDHGRVRQLRVRLEHLVLRDRRAAARAPRHDAVAAHDPAALVASPEEVPDVRDVVVRHGEVRAVPVHPLAEAA